MGNSCSCCDDTRIHPMQPHPELSLSASRQVTTDGTESLTTSIQPEPEQIVTLESGDIAKPSTSVKVDRATSPGTLSIQAEDTTTLPTEKGPGIVKFDRATSATGLRVPSATQIDALLEIRGWIDIARIVVAKSCGLGSSWQRVCETNRRNPYNWNFVNETASKLFNISVYEWRNISEQLFANLRKIFIDL